MPRLLPCAMLACVVMVAAVSTVSGQYYKGQKKEDDHIIHDPCEHFVCTTGKDGRRTFCRVAHVCDKKDTDTDDVMCNFTLPVCVSRAGADSYYDYKPDESVCKYGGSPVIHLSGDAKVCNVSEDCPMGYDCVDPDSGYPTDEDGVCCLSEKKMKKPSTCPKVHIPSHKFSKRPFYGSLYYKPIDVCMTKCYHNYDCGYGQICCYTGCGYKCVDVKKKKTTTTSATTTTTIPTTTTTPPVEAPADGDTSLLVALATGNDGGDVAITTTPTPDPAAGAVQGNVANLRTNSQCPLDPVQVICGQVMCESDEDCEGDDVCCDSKTCNKKYNPGSTCLSLNKKKKSSGGKFRGKSSFGGFDYPSAHFGKPYKSSDDSYFPKFPKLYKPYEEEPKHDHRGKDHTYELNFGSKPSPFGYDKSNPFHKSSFPSLYPPSPKFGFGSYKKPKKSIYDKHDSDKYEDKHHGDMYEDDKYGDDMYEDDKYGNDKYGKDKYEDDKYGNDKYGDDMYGHDKGFF